MLLPHGGEVSGPVTARGLEAAERAMKVVHTTGIAALAMLRRTREEPGSPQVTPPSLAPQEPTRKDPLVAGRGADAKTRAAAAAALFSVNRVTGETLLIQRVEQLGKVFGLERSSDQTFADFSAAIKETVIRLTAKPDDGKMIDAIAARIKLDPETVAQLKEQKTPDLLFRLIEKHIGLDQLGISLTSLVAAAQDLQGREAEGIIGILLRDRGESKTDKTGRTPVLVTTDDAGLYRVTTGPEA